MLLFINIIFSPPFTFNLKKIGYCNFKILCHQRLRYHLLVRTITNFSCILLKFLLHISNNQFSDKFNNGCNKIKWPIYCDFSLIILPCRHDNFKRFSCIPLKSDIKCPSDRCLRYNTLDRKSVVVCH